MFFDGEQGESVFEYCKKDFNQSEDLKGGYKSWKRQVLLSNVLFFLLL